MEAGHRHLPRDPLERDELDDLSDRRELVEVAALDRVEDPEQGRALAQLAAAHARAPHARIPARPGRDVEERLPKALDRQLELGRSRDRQWRSADDRTGTAARVGA